MRARPLSAFLAFILLALPAAAETMDHSAMDHAETRPGKADVFAPSMEKMHKAMMVAPTGDVDVDFARGMLPHHQGAVDMARVELEHGKDPELRKLAQSIVDSQEKEIAFMKEWLARKRLSK